MIQNLIPFRLTKLSLFIHDFTPYIQPRPDSRIPARFSDECLNRSLSTDALRRDKQRHRNIHPHIYDMVHVPLSQVVQLSIENKAPLNRDLIGVLMLY